MVDANNDTVFVNAAYSQQGRTGLFGNLYSSDLSRTLYGLSLKDNHRTASAAVDFMRVQGLPGEGLRVIIFLFTMFHGLYLEPCVARD